MDFSGSLGKIGSKRVANCPHDEAPCTRHDFGPLSSLCLSGACRECARRGMEACWGSGRPGHGAGLVIRPAFGGAFIRWQAGHRTPSVLRFADVPPGGRRSRGRPRGQLPDHEGDEGQDLTYASGLRGGAIPSAGQNSGDSICNSRPRRVSAAHSTADPSRRRASGCKGSITDLAATFRAVLQCGIDSRWRGGRILEVRDEIRLETRPGIPATWTSARPRPRRC